MNFPFDLSAFTPVRLDADQVTLGPEQRATLLANIGLVRDSLIFFTALANTKGLGGHTGGAYDIVPELLIADGFIKGSDRLPVQSGVPDGRRRGSAPCRSDHDHHFF